MHTRRTCVPLHELEREMSLWDLLFFWKKTGSGTPADQKPHDTRSDETVNPATGIAEVDGQILDTTEIDPQIQDDEKRFPGPKI